MTFTTRFAPSPTGPLHLGHAYSAILAHDMAKAAGGTFLLRIEDIDHTRCRDEFTRAIYEDLRWLGFDWPQPARVQSQHLDDYAAVLDRLRGRGLLYPCQCTRAEIAAAKPVIGPEGPIYPGTCKGRELTPGARIAWRLDVQSALAITGPLEWVDQIAGSQQARPELLGDPVLLRKDEPASYHLAVTLDDAADGITLVTRGADLFAASHLHRLLQALLDLPVPEWHHHDLLLDETGRKLAKRRSSPSLADRRASGEDGLLLAEQLRLHAFPSGISLGKD